MQTSVPRKSSRFFRRCLGIALASGGVLMSGIAGAATTDDAIARTIEAARRHASDAHSPTSRSEAIRLYREAAKLGSAEAQLELARVLWSLVQDPPADAEPQWLERIFPEALDRYRKAARAGDADVKYELAVVLEQSGGTTRPEYLDWLREAAELGHGRAQYDYAVRLLEGVDLSRDDAAAAKWLDRSAEQGHLEPQYLLATLHERGRGVAKNPQLAMGRYRVAAQLGHQTARAVLRTAAFRDEAPCRLDQPAPLSWRPLASSIATLHVPANASEPTIGKNEADPLHVTAPGITITLARVGDAPDDGETIVLGGDRLAGQFSGDASEGTVTLRWPLPSIDGSTVRLDVAYTEPASRDLACRIAGTARLLDPVSDLELVRIDAAASPPRALLRGERAERWAVVDDIVTRDYGRVTTIEPGHVELVELIALRGGRGWRERLVTLRPTSPSAD